MLREESYNTDCQYVEHYVRSDFGSVAHSVRREQITAVTIPERLPLPQAHEQLEEVKLEAVQDNNVELVTEILGDISSLKVKDDSAAELSRILQEPHFQVR